MREQSRIERNRIAAISDDAARSIRPRPFATPRRLVQVYTASVLPTCTPCYYLGHPVELDGTEAEGGSDTQTVDSSSSIPFVLLRGSVSAGDVLPIHHIGGRWVGERRGSPTPTPTPTSCGSCTMPAANMTVSWTNIILGNGSTTLVYSSGAKTWTSACTNQLIYQLSCANGIVTFCVTYFVSGSCPSGQAQSCCTGGAVGLRLTQTSLSCGGSSFSATYSLTSTSCPNLASNGYTGFAVNYP